MLHFFLFGHFRSFQVPGLRGAPQGVMSSDSRHGRRYGPGASSCVSADGIASRGRSGHVSQITLGADQAHEGQRVI